MDPLLIGAAGFLLENIGSLGFDKGTEFLVEKLSNKTLLKADDRVREYLMDHLQEYEYEKIDSFLAKAGVYAHDQASTNCSVLSAQTDELVNDFYKAHPALQYDRQTLTPLLKQAVVTAYQSVLSQLSTDGRVLYNQAIRNREQSRTEHQKIEDKLNNIEQLLSQAPKKLHYAEVVKIFDVLFQIINSGDFASCEPLINLMETQIDSRDLSYCTALKICLRSFIGDRREVDNLCVQFIRENPPQDLMESIVTFLLQIDQTSSLKVLQQKISDKKLFTMLSDYLSDQPINKVRSITNDDGTLKADYEGVEYALWAFANYNKKTGNRSSALATYSKIEQVNSTVWLQWSIEEIKALLIMADSMINSNSDIAEMRAQVKVLVQFLNMFKQIRNDLCVEYIETFLTCAKILPLAEFTSYYKLMSPHMKELPQSRKHWYSAQLLEWKSIDEKELKLFCEETNNDGLWSAYLLHKSTEYPEHVLTCLEENKTLLNKELTAIIAYYEVISTIKGEAIAFDTVTSLAIPKDIAFSCNVYFAELCIKLSNEKVDEYLNEAVKEALAPSCDITIIHLRDLIALLVNVNRWVDASKILEKYQERDPALMLMRLKLLLQHEDQNSICASLIEKLENIYGNNAYFIYCKGIVAEQELPGAGLELFEKAFKSQPSPQYAHAVLAARLNRKVFVDDSVLAYASNHSNIDLLYISGITYAKHGQKQKGNTALLQALINCGENYREDLYSAFVAEQLGNSDHETPPDTIAPGTCCVLVNSNIDQKYNLWIHDDNIFPPEKGINFAGYEHISPNDETAFLLLELSEGSTVTLNGIDYTITSINYGDVIATRYCMQVLIEHGVIKKLQIDTENLDTLFEEIRTMGEARSNHIQDTIEKYKSLDPGLSLEMFAMATGKPYYNTVYALTYDSNISFWAGTDGAEIDRDCVLTPSIIAVLSSLGIHPPREHSKRIKFHVPNALRVELEIQSREHRNDRTKAILGFQEDGHPYMIENTLESKRASNVYFSCLNEWAKWSESLNPVLPQDYPPELKSIANEIGIPNVEAIAFARKTNCLICCDDLLLRKYMRYLGINAPTTIDILICLEYSFDFVIEKLNVMLECNYVSPMTPNCLKWLSNKFQSAADDEQLGQYSLLAIELFEKVFSKNESRTYFLQVYQQLITDRVRLNPTLKWIITSIILKHFRSSKQDSDLA